MLDDYPTRSGYVITPGRAVGRRRGRLVPNPDEVAELHRVPLSRDRRRAPVPDDPGVGRAGDPGAAVRPVRARPDRRGAVPVPRGRAARAPHPRWRTWSSRCSPGRSRSDGVLTQERDVLRLALGRGLHDHRRPGRGAHGDQRVGSMVPSAMLACRSRAEPNSSRELFRCTRSIRPVIAFARSTTSTRSSPAANAWQVSRQNPTPNSPTASHSRASASNWRAIALSPPAVFSMRIGTANPPSSAWRSTNLRQLSTPGRGVLARGDVPAVHDQPDRPDLGRRLGVLHDQLARRDADPVVQRGQVDHVRASARRPRRRRRAARSACGCGGGFFQPCGSARNICTMSAPRSAAVATGSSSRTWAPMSMAVSVVTGPRQLLRCTVALQADVSARPCARGLGRRVGGRQPDGCRCAGERARHPPAGADARRAGGGEPSRVVERRSGGTVRAVGDRCARRSRCAGK